MLKVQHQSAERGPNKNLPQVRPQYISQKSTMMQPPDDDENTGSSRDTTQPDTSLSSSILEQENPRDCIPADESPQEAIVNSGDNLTACLQVVGAFFLMFNSWFVLALTFQNRKENSLKLIRLGESQIRSAASRLFTRLTSSSMKARRVSRGLALPKPP